MSDLGSRKLGSASPASGRSGPQRVAVVMPARDDRATIAPTVRACRAIPGVDLIIVVDDGSDDDTGQVARSAGAVVVRHSVPRGRSSAMETGVKVAAMRDRADWPPRHVLFLEPDLGDSAIEATPIVEAVMNGQADCAIGIPADCVEATRMKGNKKVAVNIIRAKTGWTPSHPLATQRCVTREALNAVMPFAPGLGVDVGMTIDLIIDGFSVVELPCAFERIQTAIPRKKPRWGSASRSDIWVALQTRRLSPRKLSVRRRPDDSKKKGVGTPYKAKDEV